ncbi:17704_t:CDS:2, partial [Gigaspora rosea]
DMEHFLDINDNDKPNGPEVREDEFQQQLQQLGNQDPVEWIETVNHAFEANNILGNEGWPLLVHILREWWQCGGKIDVLPDLILISVKMTFTRIPDLRQRVEETINQYATDMAALFRQVTVGGNQYPESMRAQVFVQGLRPDLALAVRLFMPVMLQEA